MPRRQANVNQADVQRIIRACRRENMSFRVTLQPNGAAVFEPANIVTADSGLDQCDEQRNRAAG